MIQKSDYKINQMRENRRRYLNNLNEDFHVQDTLNPKIWDTSTNKLKPEVREKIIEIVNDFEAYVNVPLEIVDVQLVGSNASYNYGPESDLDVHIIANYEIQDIPEEILQTLYNFEKTEYNSRFDISIHDVPIEMYVQDIKTVAVSNGVYSLCDDEWIKEPKPLKSVTKHNVEKEVASWEEKINLAISSGDRQEISNIIDNLYLLRQSSLATDGEYGKGNQIFKDLRAKGLLKKLREALYSAISKQLSLESYSNGQLVNRM